MDTIGINVHLHNGDTPYGNFPVISAALRDLGVRHTRDGLIPTTWRDYYRRHAELAAAGIHCDFITGPVHTDAQIQQFVLDMHGAAESLEGPNEYDKSGEPEWAARLASFMPRLHRLATGTSPGFPLKVIGPSLIDLPSPQMTRNLAAYFDTANLHNYFGGHNPGTAGWGEGGYGSIAWNLAIAKRAWGPKPVVTTETGYLSNARQEQGVGEAVQAKYLPRVLLEQQLHGIQRTYLYELSDGFSTAAAGDGSFGLLRGDGTRKPAFSSIQRLVHLLSDPGPAFTSTPLQVSIKASRPEVHHLLLQKRDGRYYLAVWLEVPATEKLPMAELTLTSPRFVRSAHIYSLDPESPAEPTLLNTKGRGLLVMPATESVSILEFTLDK